MKYLLGVFLFFIFGFTNVQLPHGIDSSLVGSWMGERSTSSGCEMLSWKYARNSDGTYQVTLFDKDQKELAKENGTWWSANGLLYMQTKGMAKPDVYKYLVKDKNSVEFSSVSADSSGDCINEPPFVDHRVKDL